MIRTDGDHKIGLGHVYRMINIASELQKSSLGIEFVTKSSGLEKIIPGRFGVRKIGSGPQSLWKIIREISPKIIILDKFKLDSNEMRILAANTRVIGIDYVGNNKKMLKSNIGILRQTPGHAAKNSPAGLKFAVLGRSVSNRKPIKISKNIKSILIVQGGSDTRCNIPKIIDFMNDISESVRLDVIVGPSFKCWKSVEISIKRSAHKVKLLHNIKNMGSVMAKSDMAITAGGMTSLELCSLGVPSVMVCGEPFENEVTALLESHGFGINIGYRKRLSRRAIVTAVRELMADHARRKEMNLNGRALVDGRGSERVAKAVLEMIR